MDYYKNEISRFPIILTKEIENNSYEQLMQGKIPKLPALNLHNGTVYRWNRPCYGRGGGKAHIRIENRYISSGPTIEDEMANFAFWIGVMNGAGTKYENIQDKMDFQDAKANFYKAAQHGTETMFKWDDKLIMASELILDEFLPMARAGLQNFNIDTQDIDTYLGIIEERVKTNTGSQWMVRNYRHLRKKRSKDNSLIKLTQALYDNCNSGKVLAQWPEIGQKKQKVFRAQKVSHIMTTNAISAQELDSARLTIEFMQWNDIHHLPIIDNHNNIKGILTWSHLQSAKEKVQGAENQLMANNIMEPNVLYVDPSTSIEEALTLAQEKGIGSLPVVSNGKLVGILTKKDIHEMEQYQNGDIGS